MRRAWLLGLATAVVLGACGDELPTDISFEREVQSADDCWELEHLLEEMADSNAVGGLSESDFVSLAEFLYVRAGSIAEDGRGDPIQQSSVDKCDDLVRRLTPVLLP